MGHCYVLGHLQSCKVEPLHVILPADILQLLAMSVVLQVQAIHLKVTSILRSRTPEEKAEEEEAKGGGGRKKSKQQQTIHRPKPRSWVKSYCEGFNDVTSCVNKLFVKADDTLWVVQDRFRCEDAALQVPSPLQLPEVPLAADDALSIGQSLTETWQKTPYNWRPTTRTSAVVPIIQESEFQLQLGLFAVAKQLQTCIFQRSFELWQQQQKLEAVYKLYVKSTLQRQNCFPILADKKYLQMRKVDSSFWSYRRLGRFSSCETNRQA